MAPAFEVFNVEHLASKLRERRMSLPPEPRVVASITVESERKQVTVLHLGVANAAMLAEQLGSGALEEAITRLADLAGDEVSHGWASILAGETYRIDGAVDVAATLVKRGLAVATGTRYWYGVGFGERIAARIARDRGPHDESAAAFGRALQTFERIGARFDASRTRREVMGEKSRV